MPFLSGQYIRRTRPGPKTPEKEPHTPKSYAQNGNYYPKTSDQTPMKNVPLVPNIEHKTRTKEKNKQTKRDVDKREDTSTRTTPEQH